MSETKPSLQKRAWDNLSSINVNDKVEKKNGLSYLSWAWAWGVLMGCYPESTYTLHQDKIMNDGSVMVGITLTIKENNEEFSRDMWLPVMNYSNRAIINPSSVEINKAYMRCLAKAVAMCGLGHYIYAGDDLPQEDDSQSPKSKPQGNSKSSPPQNTNSGQANFDPVAEFEQFRLTAEKAQSLQELQSCFGDVWKKLANTPQQQQAKDFYEVRKAEFEQENL
ncbi:Sak single strand annealing protein [Ursidibacter arcticus]